MKKVLTIAGSDSGGGAGIQADLKVFFARGVYGMSAITAITAQNTLGVQRVFELPAAVVGQQIDSVMDDIGADSWKLGMLANEEIINIVVNRIEKYKIKLLVLDPVMVSKSGHMLLRKEANNALIKKLFPKAFVMTPNLPEASVIIGKKITSFEEMKQAAIIIHKMGAKNVVVKGGHLENSQDTTDILYDGKEFYEYKAERIKTKNTHGTGCTFSSVIAAELAKKNSLKKAVSIAKDYITQAIKTSKNLQIGKGFGPLNHSVSFRQK